MLCDATPIVWIRNFVTQSKTTRHSESITCKTLRNFQTLPTRAATCAVFLLLGALPIDAEIHRRQLSFVHSILACDNSTIQGLTDRQLVMNFDNPHSFFCKVAGTLTLYELPTIRQLKQHLPSKLPWKLTVKKGNTTLLDRISIKRDARQINVTFYGSNHIENWIYSSYLDKSIVHSF
jgi:hypothetical protein